MSLNDVLSNLGYTTEPGTSPTGGKNILRDGLVVFTGTAHDVWTWLHETCQHTAHGRERDRTVVTERYSDASTLEQTVLEKWCARCGWVDVKGITGVTGTLQWMSDHDDHAPSSLF